MQETRSNSAKFVGNWNILIDRQSSSSVEQALYESLAESRGISAAVLRIQLGPADEIDSLEGVELIVFAEARFGVHFSDRELTPEVCRSIPRLAVSVHSKMAAGNHTEEIAS
jgi:acyl carrier protein